MVSLTSVHSFIRASGEQRTANQVVSHKSFSVHFLSPGAQQAGRLENLTGKSGVIMRTILAQFEVGEDLKHFRLHRSSDSQLAL